MELATLPSRNLELRRGFGWLLGAISALADPVRREEQP